jgi:hypothetical protein
MGSDLSEPSATSEITNRRMYSDVSGSLSYKAGGSTPNAQMNNTGFREGERHYTTTIFILEVRDNRTFLAWFRANYPGGLTVQLKAEKLIVVPSTANAFRASVRALRSLVLGGWEFPHCDDSRRNASCCFW